MTETDDKELEKLIGICKHVQAALLEIYTLKTAKNGAALYASLMELLSLLWMRAADLAHDESEANRILKVVSRPLKVQKMQGAAILEQNPDFLKRYGITVAGDFYTVKAGAPDEVAPLMADEIQRILKTQGAEDAF